MLRCLIVDDSPPFFNAARDLLEHQGASVVGVARTSDEAVRRVEELHPDVTLVDVNLAEESGFELARRLSGEVGVAPGQLILISTQARDEFADLISDSPVAGFLSKSELSVDRIRELLAAAD